MMFADQMPSALCVRGAADMKQSFPTSKALAKIRDAGTPSFTSNTGLADERPRFQGVPDPQSVGKS